MPEKIISTDTKKILVDPNTFDVRTHTFNARGRLQGKSPYRMMVKDGVRLFERPVGSGNIFYENNEPAGRVECTFNAKGKIAGRKFDHEAKHKEYTPKLTAEQEMENKLLASEAKAAALQKELDAINREKEAAQVGAPSRKVGDEEHAVGKTSSPAPSTKADKTVNHSIKDVMKGGPSKPADFLANGPVGKDKDI